MKQSEQRLIIEDSLREMPLDEEWVALLQSAREIGLTVDDIRAFLYKTDPFIIRKQ